MVFICHSTDSKPMSRSTSYYAAPDISREKRLTGVPLASFSSRVKALVIDFVLCAIVFMVAVSLLGPLLISSGLLNTDEDVVLELNFMQNWYSVIILVLYFAVSLYLGKGQTPGKRLAGIRVISLVHDRLSLWHCIERALGYGASTLELGMGFFQYFWRKDRRTMHDQIAETIVVSVSPAEHRILVEERLTGSGQHA